MTQAVTRPSVPPQLFGLALLLAWEILVAPFRQAFNLVDTPSLPHSYLASLPTALMLIAVAWYARTSKRPLWSRPTVILCGACAVAVPIFDLAQITFPQAAMVLAIASILPKAAAHTGLFLMWNAQLAGYRAYVAWTVYAGSFAGATVLFFLANALGPLGLAVAVFVLPIGSCLLYERCRALPREESASEGTVVWKFPWRPVVLMVAFSFAYHLALNFGGDIQVASELGRFLVAGVVLLCLVRAFDRFDVGILYKVCPTFVVAGLLLCLTGNPEATGGLRGFLVSAGYSGFTLYVYMTLNTVCYRFGAPAEWLFGLTRAGCMIVGVPNSLLNAWSLAYAQNDTALYIVGAVVTVLMLLSMLLLTDRTPVTTWGIKAVRIGNEEIGVPRQPIDTISYLEDSVYRCALVARHYGLTHREEEVLALLSRGSSLPEIREELSIANGTLRAHVQHIYAKLDVHSYEEAREIARGWKP